MSIEDEIREQARHEEKLKRFEQEHGLRAAGNMGSAPSNLGPCLAGGAERYTVRNALKAQAAQLEREAAGLRAIADALPTAGLSARTEELMVEAVNRLRR